MADLILDATGAESTPPSPPSRPPGRAGSLRPLLRDGPATRAVLGIAAVATAFHHSLWTLISSLGVDSPLAYLGLVPFVALGLIVVLARPRPGELAVHDTYLDRIIGIPLLIVPLVVLAEVPGRMGTLFWLWRVDLLVLPLFAAGVIALLFGTRTLLRAKAGVVFLFVAWPAPFQYVLQRWLDAFTSVTVSVVGTLSGWLHLSTPAPRLDGGFVVSTPSGGRFTVMVASQCSGANSLLGYLLIGGALLVVLRGSRGRKAAWLVAGGAIVWAANVTRICLIFLSGVLWGERVAIDGFHPYIGLVTFGVATAAAVWMLPRFGLTFGTAPRTPDLARRTMFEAVPAVGVVLVIVTALMIPTAVLDARLARVDPIASALGLPRLLPFKPTLLDSEDFTGTRINNYSWAGRYFGDGSDWTRYEFTGGSSKLSTEVPVIVDVVTTSDSQAFDDFGVEACYAFHGYDVTERRTFDLGTGVSATMLVWKDPDVGIRWESLFWYWPVLEDGTTHYQRIVLLMAADRSGDVVAPAAASHPGHAVDVESSGENLAPDAAAADRTATRQRLLVGMGRVLVRETVRRATGAD